MADRSDEAADYRVTWRIDVSATDEKDAARKALAILRDPSYFAVFEVEDLETVGYVEIDTFDDGQPTSGDPIELLNQQTARRHV